MSGSRNVNIILNKLSVMIISNKVKGNILCTQSNVMSIGIGEGTLLTLKSVLGLAYVAEILSGSSKK